MKTLTYRRAFTVDDSAVALALEITSPHQPADVDAIISELAAELGGKIFKRLWDRSEMIEALERQQSSGRPRQAREFRQLADLAWQRGGPIKWKPIALADLAAEAGLLHEILQGHRPGHKLSRKRGPAFGWALATSKCFRVSGKGHDRVYSVVEPESHHVPHHSTHHVVTQPAPLLSVRNF